jgi:hypothetical protein
MRQQKDWIPEDAVAGSPLQRLSEEDRQEINEIDFSGGYSHLKKGLLVGIGEPLHRPLMVILVHPLKIGT